LNRYILEERLQRENNAGPKARNDVQTILVESGFKKFRISSFQPRSQAGKRNSILLLFYRLLNVLSVVYSLLKLESNSIVFIQYYILKVALSKRTMGFLFGLSKRAKRQHLVAFVHDLECVRLGSSVEEERQFLSCCDSVIVHNSNMNDYLLGIGLASQNYYILNLFDYLAQRGSVMDRRLSFSVDFAGNLGKSTFLSGLKRVGGETLFRLYGDCASVDALISRNVLYQGSFSPDEIIMKLSGSFGLVWDGDSVDTCGGTYGRYMQINSTHKASLYLVAGLPLIVWNKSGIADHVLRKNLGIVVGSIFEIEDKVRSLTEEDYIEMAKSALAEGTRLRGGENLLGAVDAIYDDLGCRYE